MNTKGRNDRVSAFDAKTHLSQLLQQAEQGKTITITRRGKPVARLLPSDSDCARLIGSMKGKIRIHGDILSTGLKWDAES